MRWIKKYYYFILLIGGGVWYLSVIDHWNIYTEPVCAVKGLQESLWGGESVFLGNGTLDAFSWERFLTAAENGRDVCLFLAEAKREESGEEAGGGDIVEPSASSPEGGGSEPLPDSDPIDQTEGDPSYCAVEDDYFKDALFIGDSRTVGMFEYGGLQDISTFYASTGLTVYKIFDSEIVSVPGEKKKITVEEALKNNTFAKIYLMIGINEMGTGTVDTFLEKYREVVEHLKELQPDAMIYLQAIIKVTSERSSQGDYINNEGITARNEGIAQMADNVKVFYLDVNPFICDETGGLEASYTFDGVHLKAKYIEIWKDFLKTHAISS